MGHVRLRRASGAFEVTLEPGAKLLHSKKGGAGFPTAAQMEEILQAIEIALHVASK